MHYFQNRWPGVLLWPLSKIYRAAVQKRNQAFDSGHYQSRRLDRPVISIGNITVGGTGKTPTVIFLAQWLQARNKRVCVLSRGYGRSKNGMVLVSDGEKIHANALQGGDEPILIAQRVPGAMVVVDANRGRAGEWALEQFQPDVFILDDGFQHRQLYRDLDIVTFKGGRSLGNGWLLPAGPLREPVENLERAHLYWHNQAQGKRLDVGVIKPVITADLSYEGFYNKDGQALEYNKKLRVLAFCGLANPHDFAASLQAHGLEIVRLVHFKDHYYYRHRDIQELEVAKERSRADLIITTQKDWVKLAFDHNLPSHWYCLHIAVQPENSQRADEILGNLCSGMF